MHWFSQPRVFKPLPAVSRREYPEGEIIHGDCTQVMRRLPSESVDFILTDPPYITRYRDRSGRSVANDNNSNWLMPSVAEMYRLLKPGRFCVSFYGWNKIDLFMAAWRSAGFRPVGHLIFRKRYASSVRFLRCEHEAAFLLAKGEVTVPATPIPDVLDWVYTGNRLHPTQKPAEVLKPLITAFCPPSGVVLDPFCGSGSTLLAAKDLGRRYLGMELEEQHYRTAMRRLDATSTECAIKI